MSCKYKFGIITFIILLIVGVVVRNVLVTRARFTHMVGYVLTHNVHPSYDPGIFYCGKNAANKLYSNKQTRRLCKWIKKRDLKRIQKAVDAGANVNDRSWNNIPVLQWAYFSNADVLELLLKNGADPNFIIESDFDIPGVNLKGQTLLYEATTAAQKPDFQFSSYAEILLKYGADANLGELSPLVAAISSGNSSLVEKLLESGADPNKIGFRQVKNNMPVYFFPVVESVGAGNTTTLLLEHGADYDINGRQGSLLQNRLCEITRLHKDGNTQMSSEDYQGALNAVQWLEDHGVSFEKKAPIVSLESYREDGFNNRLTTLATLNDQLRAALDTNDSKEVKKVLHQALTLFTSALEENKFHRHILFADDFCQFLPKLFTVLDQIEKTLETADADIRQDFSNSVQKTLVSMKTDLESQEKSGLTKNQAEVKELLETEMSAGNN